MVQPNCIFYIRNKIYLRDIYKLGRTLQQYTHFVLIDEFTVDAACGTGDVNSEHLISSSRVDLPRYCCLIVSLYLS